MKDAIIMSKRSRGEPTILSERSQSCGIFATDCATTIPTTPESTDGLSDTDTPPATPRISLSEGIATAHKTLLEEAQYTPAKATLHVIAQGIGSTVIDVTPVKLQYEKAKLALPTLSSPMYQTYLKTITSEAVRKVLSLYSGSDIHTANDIFSTCTASLRKFIHAVRSDSTEALDSILGSVLERMSLSLHDTKTIASYKSQLLTQCFTAITNDHELRHGATLSIIKKASANTKQIDKLAEEYLVPSFLLSNTWRLYSQATKTIQEYQAKTLTSLFFADLESNEYFVTPEFQKECFFKMLRKSFYETKNAAPEYRTCSVLRYDEDKENPSPLQAKDCFLAAKITQRQMSLASEELTSEPSPSSYKCVVTTHEEGLTTVHKVYKTGACASKLPALGKYLQLKKQFSKINKFHPDKELAIAMLDILKGQNILTKIYDGKILGTDVIKLLSDTVYLLFSTEVCRTPSAAIVNAMFLDLVAHGIKSLSNITDLPIAQSKVMPALRALNKLSSNYHYDRADHITSAFSHSLVHEVLKKTNDIVFPWLRMEGLDVQYPMNTDHDTIKRVVHKIESAANKWFDMEIHRSTYPDELYPSLVGVSSLEEAA